MSTPFSAPTTSAGCAALLGLARASGESVLEVPDAPGRDEETDFPTAMAVRHDQPYAAWVTIQVGCDNSCAFCIVPAVRGPEVSRPFGELVEELGRLAAGGTVEVTLLGQNVNSYGRDLTTKMAGRAGRNADLAWIAGQRWAEEGALRARPLFADLLRAARCGARHSPRPLHEPASEGPAPRDHSRHGRDARGL